MNEHLKPVFEIVLPKITSANISYWVYGGLGYASMVGQFYRSNPDVDLFVLDNDFQNVNNLLDNLCKDNSWKICKTFIRSGRPKIELCIKEKERLSVIPVCKTGNSVEFTFREGSKEYPLEILTQVERHLGGYRFQTPQDSFLKTLLIGYLKSKKNYPNRKKRIEDAKHVLTTEEFLKYFPTENT
jgi:hypothetical protein